MLKYTNWKDGCVRVYDGSAWITVTADGRVVDQNKPIPVLSVKRSPNPS